MQALYAVPEALLLQGALCDLARYYGLPSWGYAGCSSAKLFDEQAVMEATIFTLLGALQGCNIMHDVFYIESGRTGSLELLVLMDEVISRVKFLLRGINCSPEHLAVEAVRRVGPGGSFLGDEHTARHFRDSWQPELSDFNSYSAWEEAGSKTMGDRIKEKIGRLLEEHRPLPLDSAAEKKIDKIIERAQEKMA
jgi:trimethylamine--corrinoid protein Co-methyltransferase